MTLVLISSIHISFFSIITFLLVLLFLEFCVFCYFVPNIMAIFKKGSDIFEDDNYNEKTSIKNKTDDVNIEELDEELPPLSPYEGEWEQDELSIDEIKPIVLPKNEWVDDTNNKIKKDPNSLLLEIDSFFKLDEFYLQVYDLYMKIANFYTEDNIRGAEELMTKELYKENVRQLDSFRKRNLRHVVEVIEYLNCKIMDAKVIDRQLYVKVELTINAYDYIINKSSQKVQKGISTKPLYSVYHLILQKELKPLPFSHVTDNNSVIPSIVNASNLNDDKWVLAANRIVKRR